MYILVCLHHHIFTFSLYTVLTPLSSVYFSQCAFIQGELFLLIFLVGIMCVPVLALFLVQVYGYKNKSLMCICDKYG